MNKFLSDRVENFFLTEMALGAGDLAIFKNDDGSYELFNRYKVQKNDQNHYYVTHKYNYDFKVFSKLQHAVTWCIYEKRNKINDSKRIEELDRNISSAEVAIQNHQKLISKSKNLESSLIYMAKLNEEKLKKQAMLEELKGYVLETNYWKNKVFARKDQK